MITLNKINGLFNRSSIELYGKSTDVKPLVFYNGKFIGNGSTFTEVDTGNIYMYDEENQRWYHQNGDNPPYPPIIPDYLCFTCDGERALISVKVMWEDLSYEPSYSFIPNLEVSFDKITWRTFNCSWNDDIIELSNGESVYFRGTNDYFGWDYGEYGYQFYIDDDGSGALVKASGNIMSILDPTCESLTLNEVGGFPCLFYECTALSEAPDLPATTLSGGCYSAMFYGCTSLTSAPALPATTLDTHCYLRMFRGCHSLVEAPELPATELTDFCYCEMFAYCTSLTTAPDLLATDLENFHYCYEEMFDGCSSLNSLRVGFSEWKTSCTTDWLKNVSPTGTFTCPTDLPNTPRNASHIPEGWTIMRVEPDGSEGLIQDGDLGEQELPEENPEPPEEEIVEEPIEEEPEHPSDYEWEDANNNGIPDWQELPPEEIVGGN